MLAPLCRSLRLAAPTGSAIYRHLSSTPTATLGVQRKRPKRDLQQRNPESNSNRGDGGPDRTSRQRGGGRARESDPGNRRPRPTGLEAPANSVVWDATIQDPRPLGLGFMHDEQRWQIYNQYLAEPERWTLTALAQHHQISVARVRAIIILKGREMEIRSRGELPIGDGRTILFEEMCAQHLKKMSAHYKLPIRNNPKFKQHGAASANVPSYKEYRLLTDLDDADAIRERAARNLEKAREAKGEADAESSVPQEYYELRPKTKHAFAFKEISNQEAPTRIYTKGEGIREAKVGEDLRRTWTNNPHYIDTIPLDNPGYNPSLSAGPRPKEDGTDTVIATDEGDSQTPPPPYDDSN